MITALPLTVRQALGDGPARDFTVWFEAILDDTAMGQDERNQISQRFDRVDERFNAVDERFDAVDERFDRVDERFNAVNERFDRVDKRLDHVEAVLADHDLRLVRIETRLDEQGQRLDRIEVQFTARFDRLDDKFDRLNGRMLVQTRWTIGVLGLFGTLMAGLVALSQFSH
jgi:chromosome segregation ATPase